MIRYWKIIAGLLLAFTLYRCNPVDPLDTQITYRPHYVGPLAYVEMDPLEILDLIDKKSTYTVLPTSLFIPGFAVGTTINVPPLGPIDIKPNYTDLADMFSEISVNEAVIRIEFTNTFPITINAGTAIVGRDSASGIELFRHVLPIAVTPGQFYEATESAYNKSLFSDLEVQIVDFTSPGGNEVIFSGDPLEIDITIEVLDLDVVRLRPEKTYTLEFDTPVDLSFNADSVDGDVSGYLSVFLRNNIPTAVTMSINFLDAQKDTIYKVFDTPAYIPAPTIDAAGNVSAYSELDLVNLVNLDTVDIANQAAYVYMKFFFETPAFANLMNVADGNYLRVQLSANVEITLIDTP